MNTTVQNILVVITAGVILFAGVFIFRVVLKVAWKIIRTALIVVSTLLIAGYFLGFLDLTLR